MLSPESILKILKEECNYQDGDSIVVGVSGGADSVALLHLLHAAKVPVAAAHVNYGLRGEESDGDEKFVRTLCEGLSVPLYTRRTDREQLKLFGNNFQDSASLFRENFLGEISAKESMNWISYAHHADDQMETVLMNFMRGSGLMGLSGMLKVHGFVLRPLLSFSRKNIEEYLSLNKIEWRNDSSNEKDDYLRNRIRHHLVPLLHELDPRSESGMQTSMKHITEGYQLLWTSCVQIWDSIARTDGSGKIFVNRKKLLEFVQPRLLFNFMGKFFIPGWQYFTHEQFRRLLNSQTGTAWESKTHSIVAERDELVILQTIFYPTLFKIRPGYNEEGWSCKQVVIDDPKNISGYEAVVNCSPTDELVVRSWKEGDRIAPIGFHGTKKVSDVLTEMKVMAHEKEHYPVLTVNDEVAWIPGYRIAEKFKVTDTSKPALHIKWNR